MRSATWWEAWLQAQHGVAHVARCWKHHLLERERRREDPSSLGARPAQVLPGVLGRQLAADAVGEAPRCAVSSAPVPATDAMLSSTPGQV